MDASLDPGQRLERLERELALVLEALSDPRASPERLGEAWRACARGPALERELSELVEQARLAEPAGSERARASLERLRRLNALTLDLARRQREELERTLELARTAVLRLRSMLPVPRAGDACDVHG